MPINVKISLCKITAASKLFQRNYYLPLLKPLSPKDALRRKIITGQNILGNRIEHYIPTLVKYEDKTTEKKKRPKGAPVIKKKVKINSDLRYVSPFLDEEMENHHHLQRIYSRKGKGRGQYYVYDVPDKNSVLAIPHQMEKAIKDKEIIDIMIAQRSEKIVVKLNNGIKIVVPVAKFDGSGPLYRGSGWTKEHIEEEHHHGKETMSLAKIFEAKESGVEEWELEMMRLANKRKKKIKGSESADWKEMMTGCLDGMDWDQFEEDTKKIVEEVEEIVEQEDIPMAVDNMEKTKNVSFKLTQGGDAVLSQLPTMKQVPEVIKKLETGDMSELSNVSGVRIKLSDEKSYFVVGQMVKTDENEVFVPGQTITSESGICEYTPGITVFMDNEPTLIPGLVMGEEEQTPMFLPGESAITEGGQLVFQAVEEDYNPGYREVSPPDEEEQLPPPKSTRKLTDEPIEIRRRVIDEPEPLIKERVKKRPPIEMGLKKELTPPRESFRPQRQPLEDPLLLMEERRRQRDEEERKRLKERTEQKILEEEMKVDKLRLNIRKKLREFKVEKPTPFVPMEPVKKSSKLAEMEESINRGTFFEDERTKQILQSVRNASKLSKYNRAFVSYNEIESYSTSSVANVKYSNRVR